MSHLPRGLIAALILAVCLAACSGATDPTTNITSTSATLNGHYTCDASATSCLIWAQYRIQGQTAWTSTPTQNAAADGQQHTYTGTLQNLQPSTTYEWQGCAQETINGSTNSACGGSDGQSGTINTFATLAASSTPMFAENFVTPTQPIYNTTGGTASNPQAWNYGDHTCTPFGGAGKCPGNWYPDAGHGALQTLAGITNYGDMNMPASSSCPQTCGFEFVANGPPAYQTNFLGQTTYHLMEVYIPTGFTIPTSDGATEIQELHFANIFNGAPVRVGLYADHVTLWLDTGQCTQQNGQTVGCAVHSKKDPTAGCPAVTTTCLPATYIVPPGGLAQGTWNEIILGVHWATDSTGSIQMWHRTPGSPAWTQEPSVTGIPTVQYLNSSNVSNMWDDAGGEAYGYSPTSTFDVYEAGYVDCMSFDCAATSALK